MNHLSRQYLNEAERARNLDFGRMKAPEMHNAMAPGANPDANMQLVTGPQQQLARTQTYETAGNTASIAGMQRQQNQAMAEMNNDEYKQNMMANNQLNNFIARNRIELGIKDDSALAEFGHQAANRMLATQMV